MYNFEERRVPYFLMEHRRDGWNAISYLGHDTALGLEASNGGATR